MLTAGCSSSTGNGSSTPTGTPASSGSPQPALTVDLQAPVPSRARERGGHPVVYVTFDDGPSSTNTPPLLTILRRHHAHATFFVIGRFARANPSLVKAEIAAGHAVGGHSWSHPHLTELSSSKVRAQLVSTRDLLRGLGSTARCFRPPFGETDSSVRTIASDLHLHQYLWTTESKDWTHASTAADLRRALDGLEPGAVIVFHDGDGSGSAQSRAAVDEFLTAVSKRGYVADALPC